MIRIVIMLDVDETEHPYPGDAALVERLPEIDAYFDEQSGVRLVFARVDGRKLLDRR